MVYEKHLAAGRGMGDEEIRESLKTLMRDPRFAAVAAVIDRIKTEVADESCREKYAGQHGSLEHAAGMRAGLLTLEQWFKAAAAVKKRTGMQKPEE